MKSRTFRASGFVAATAVWVTWLLAAPLERRRAERHETEDPRVELVEARAGQ